MSDWRPRMIGRYLLCDEIASGGMATVHLARLFGEEGFSRIVAVKRLHPQFARDEEFVSMFLNEARLLSRIHHPNVIAPLDVVRSEGELFIVMEHVYGDSVSRLIKAMAGPTPVSIAVAISIQTLLGLHAAHDATDAYGQPLQIVHRDVSPQNILVGADGIARVVDFGIAKAAISAHTTRDGQLRGKFGYFAPEQLALGGVDRRTDIFTAGIVLWETLTGQRLFAESVPAAAADKILSGGIVPPSEVVGELPRALDSVVLRALSLSPSDRFPDARSMACELERVASPAGALETGAWVERLAGPTLVRRELLISKLDELSLSELTLSVRMKNSQARTTNDAPPRSSANARPSLSQNLSPDATGPVAPSAPSAEHSIHRMDDRDSTRAALHVATEPSRNPGFTQRRFAFGRYFWRAALVAAFAAAVISIVPLVRSLPQRALPPTILSPTSSRDMPSDLGKPESSRHAAADAKVELAPLTAVQALRPSSAVPGPALARGNRTVLPPRQQEPTRSTTPRRTATGGGTSSCRKAFDAAGHWTLICSP